ncbi:MAG TPA: hypothetical protein EYP40_10780 [Chromatiales bacterium]|nr:hypothetical protein [Chromatiales bacterium]
MTTERQIQRYAAYFKGWCQAFGEHESVAGEESEITWLLGEEQIGLILPREVSKSLYREALGRKHETPALSLSSDRVRVGAVDYHLSHSQDKTGFAQLLRLLGSDVSLHLFLSYHLTYEKGTRIVTFSRKAPLNIIYKAIGPMQVRLP